MARRASLAPALAPRLAAFVQPLPAALAGDAAAVHQARVASRRLREVVPMLAALDDRDRRAARRRLRRMTRTLGRLREADVSAQIVETELVERGVPAVAAAAVRRFVAAQRAKALRELRRTWTRRRLARLRDALDALRRAAEASTRREAAHVVALRLESRARRARRALQALGVLYSPDRLHAVRIAVKRWRYAVELAAEVGYRRPVAMLAALRAVQDALGRAHDLHVAAMHLGTVEARVVTRSRTAARALRAAERGLDAECRALHASFLLDAPLAGVLRSPAMSRRSGARSAA